VGLDPSLVAISLCGAFFGYLLFLRWWGRPWDGAHRSASKRLARRIARAVPVVSRRAELSRSDLLEVEAFYTRWVNLARDEREAHRESLRREGIDMIHLGDSLRWFRDHP